MTSAAKHTAGPVSVYSFGSTIAVCIGENADGKLPCIVDWPGFDSCGLSIKKQRANAEFIAEAFNVSHETGLTPRQLAERCKELEAAAIKVRSWLAVECCDDPLKVIDDALRSLGITDVPCPECGGAGEWDEGPLPVSYGQISPDYRQVTCSECSGTGRAAIAKATAGGAV